MILKTLYEMCACESLFLKSGAPAFLGTKLTIDACNNREFLVWWSAKNTVRCLTGIYLNLCAPFERYGICSSSIEKYVWDLNCCLLPVARLHGEDETQNMYQVK